jgi:hypothetical protein
MDFTNLPTTAGELFQWAVTLTLLGILLQAPLNRMRDALLAGIGRVSVWSQPMRERRVRDEEEPGRYLHYYVSSIALFISAVAALAVMLAVGRTMGLVSPTFGFSRESVDSVIVFIVAIALVLGGAYAFYRFRWLSDPRNELRESDIKVLDRGPDERKLALGAVALAAIATVIGAFVRALALLTDTNATLGISDENVRETVELLARIGVVIFWVVAELSFISTGVIAHPGLEFSAAQSLRFLGWLIYLVVAAVLGIVALAIAILVYIPNRVGDGIRALWRRASVPPPARTAAPDVTVSNVGVADATTERAVNIDAATDLPGENLPDPAPVEESSTVESTNGRPAEAEPRN